MSHIVETNYTCEVKWLGTFEENSVKAKDQFSVNVFISGIHSSAYLKYGQVLDNQIKIILLQSIWQTILRILLYRHQ